MSAGIIRTNPLLTTNVQLIYSGDKLYFESYAIPALNDEKYKEYLIPEDSTYNIEIAKYWKNTPSDLAYTPFTLDDYDTQYNTYDKQVDDTYLMGSKYVDNYEEEFQFHAPLYIEKNIPNNFIIFRVDEPGHIDINSSNFRTEILNKLKVVNNFDLSKKNKLGKFLRKSFDNIEESKISVDFNQEEFTYWNGIDFNTGEFTEKGKLLSEEFKKEMTFSQGHKILTDGFKENEVVYNNIVNLNFMFNDTPATPTSLREWSINRYYGFYCDIEETLKISPYSPPKLKEGLKIENNFFILNNEYVDPFERGYKIGRTYYIEYNSDFYLVKKIGDKFKVITDIELPQNVDGNFNVNTISITNNIIKKNDINLNLDTNVDVYIININDKYYRLLNTSSGWKIHSDYNFVLSNNILRYYINNNQNGYSEVVNLNDISESKKPEIFKIYKVNFKELLDFDLDILETEYSKFEYEIDGDITQTEEPKLYEDDLSFTTSDKPIEKYIFNNNVVSIPTANEFLASGELYEINENRPNLIWEKNSKYNKWGIKNSIANNDYRYMFNINKKGDSFNRCPDVESLIPLRSSRNLDYFYTIASSSYTFGYNEIKHQSLSLINNSFDIELYMTSVSTDYFDVLFNQKETYNNKEYSITKCSKFLKGDTQTPNMTYFKGIKFMLYDVNSVETSIQNGQKAIDDISVSGTEVFNDYKFSVLLSDYNKNPNLNFATISNNSSWKLIKNWERNTTYYPGDIVLFDGTKFKDGNSFGFPGYGIGVTGRGTITPIEYEYPDGTTETLTIDNNFNLTLVAATGPNLGVVSLFTCSATTSITDPNQTIIDDSNFSELGLSSSIFYTPGKTYSGWTSSTNYSTMLSTYEDYVCFYKGEYYKSLYENKDKTPEVLEIDQGNGLQIITWQKIQEYNTKTTYVTNDILTKNGDLYYYNSSTNSLDILHSFTPNTSVYNQYDIIKFNDNFYIDVSGGSKLDNGINVYINKVHKNVLVNIYFNDNLVNTYNVKRDDLYNVKSQQLVANNFISYINDISNKNGFINNINYYIIDIDGNINSYNINNIENIPHILQCEVPSDVEYYTHSLQKIPRNINALKVSKKLNNNLIENTNQINYFADQPLGIEIKRLDNFTFKDRKDSIYRFSGDYDVIFKHIPIFDNIGDNRYKFNENLENFGETKIIKSKVNKKNIMKLSRDSENSIYPQIDEIGYFEDTHNIFKSTWDTKYYKKVDRNI
jgi:hypothetical protein